MTGAQQAANPTRHPRRSSVNIVIPYDSGIHRRALALFVAPLLEARGHTVQVVHPMHRSQREIGDYVASCDVLVTTTPWWCYANMWINAAHHFGKPWVYHPEGWDNCHPLVSPQEQGHAKNQPWPFIPDRMCAHGTAQGRVLTGLRHVPPEQITYTGGPRFDVYGIYWDEIRNQGSPFTDTERPVILVCTTDLWDHTFLIQAIKDAGYAPVISQHPVDLYDRYDHLRCRIIRAPGSDATSPLRDHGYDPGVEQLLAYARQLAHADVVVNVAGTPSLEAHILGTPVVNINCLPDEAPERERGKLYCHYGMGSYFLDTKPGETSYLATSRADIPVCVERALGGPDDERRAAISTMLQDVLSITYTQDRPSQDASFSICNAIEGSV